MRKSVEIENIEELRLREGIDDVELRRRIRGLKIGDSVRLTFRAGAKSPAAETLSVRITSIRGPNFRGKLTKAPQSALLTALTIGSFVAFTTDQIHSLPKGPVAPSEEITAPGPRNRMPCALNTPRD